MISYFVIVNYTSHSYYYINLSPLDQNNVVGPFNCFNFVQQPYIMKSQLNNAEHV